MAKVRLETGQVLNFEGDPTQEQIENAISQVQGGGQQLATQATEEQFLGAGERFRGGFMEREDLTRVREVQRAERGLAPGTALEPTGLNLRNALDLPGDLADIVGGSLPILGATIGGILSGAVALPTGPGALTAVAGGGAVGGAGGEFLRQEIGRQFFKFDQGEILDRLGDVAREGAYGALQEVGGVFLGRMINATKIGILNTAGKLLKHRGGEGFVKGFGSLATHVDKAKIQFALDAVKRGDKRVLSKVFSDKNFANKFAKELMLGKDGNFAQNIFNLARRTKNAKEPIKDLFVRRLGLIKADDFEVLFSQGNKVNRFRNPQMVLKLGEKINSGLDEMFNKSGRELSIARQILKRKAAVVDVPELTQVNAILARKLKAVGLLIEEGDGLFSINPQFDVTRTGKAQAGMFAELVDRFFSKQGVGGIPLKGTKTKGTFTIGDAKVLQQLVEGAKAGRKTIYNVRNSIKFGNFIDNLGTLDVQISGAEFKQLGKLSPELTMYLRGLRDIPMVVEQKIGGSQVATLTNTFREFAENASLLRQGSKVKSSAQIERVLQRLAKAEPGTLASTEAGELNAFLQKNLDVNFIDELRAFKTAQVVKEVESTFGTTRARQGLVNIMKDAFSESNIAFLDDVAGVDRILPSHLRIAENAQIHTVAESLTKNAASILRGKFMWNAAIAPVVGGSIGLAGGPIGGSLGVVTGLALQQPGILRALIQASAKLSNAEVRKLVGLPISNLTKQAMRSMPAGARLLRELLRQR